MTNDMMTLCGLIENSDNAEFLREMIGFTAQRLMELEVVNADCILTPIGLVGHVFTY